MSDLQETLRAAVARVAELEEDAQSYRDVLSICGHELEGRVAAHIGELRTQVAELERERDAQRREATQLRSELIASDALRRGAESALAQARVEGAREFVARYLSAKTAPYMSDGLFLLLRDLERFRDREYPAVPPEREGAQECKVVEYDGAFKCLTHKRKWGAILNPDEPCRPTPPQAAQSIVSTDGLGHTTTVHINPATITPTYAPPAAPERVTPKQVIERIRDAAQGAIAHVGAANYRERQEEAHKAVDEACNAALVSLASRPTASGEG